MAGSADRLASLIQLTIDPGFDFKTEHFFELKSRYTIIWEED